MPPVASLTSTTVVTITLTAAVALLLWQLPRVRGSTFTAPVAWAAAALLSYVLLEATLLGPGEAWRPFTVSAMRYVAAVGTLCPLVAILGAKRPQDRAWQWIVASLWVILALPALQGLARPVGDHFALAGAWKWFVALLLVVSWLVYAPTRYWHAAMLAVAGQAVLLWPALAGGNVSQGTQLAAIGATLLLAALAAALVVARRPRALRVDDASYAEILSQPLRRWLAFRDQWGALWALRVMARVNQTAEIQHWPVRLRMSGFDDSGSRQGQETPADGPALRDRVNGALDGILRRFEA